jgi:hypothetical protein
MLHILDAARAVACQQNGLISAGQLLQLGCTRQNIRNLLRSRARAVLPGIYLLDPHLHPDNWGELPLRTRIQAAVLFHGPETVICLDTAGRVLRVQGLGFDDGTVHVLLPPGRERHQAPGIRVHTRLLDEHEVMEIGGVRLTTPQRTVLDLVLASASADMRTGIIRRRNRAIHILDSALNRKLLLPEDLVALQRAGRGRRGIALCRAWWELADARSESPLETEIRLIAVDANMPPDELQLPVLDDHGVLLGFGDLAWKLRRGRWLVAEADGAEVHESPSALFRDRRRANDFVATGRVVLIRFTWADAQKPAYVVSQIRKNLAIGAAAS